MVFEHIKHELPSLLQETAEDGTRCYATPDGKRYPSVTTVLSDFNKDSLDAWRKRVGETEANRISKAATTRGTAVHLAIETFLNNEPINKMELMPNAKAIFHRMKSELLKLNNIHCLESRLFSHDLKLAGTVDCIAEYDGKLSVIDFKTSTRLKKKADIANYFMQGAAYSIMFEEMTGIKTDQVVILIGVESTEFPQVMKVETKDFHQGLRDQISKYYGVFA